MKRKLAVVFCACFTLFAFAGCANFNTQLENTVSEIHERVLYGRSEEFEVTVTMGKIEADFVLDGVKTALKDFIAFKVTPLNSAANYTDLGISYRFNEQSVEHNLEKSPKHAVWTLRLDGTMNTEALEVVIFNEKDNFIVATEKVDTGNFSPLDKLKETFKDELMATHDGSKFNCEITMRLVKNSIDTENKFYWFVVAHTTKKDYFGIMVDIETGDVVSQKK